MSSLVILAKAVLRYRAINRQTDRQTPAKPYLETFVDGVGKYNEVKRLSQREKFCSVRP